MGPLDPLVGPDVTPLIFVKFASSVSNLFDFVQVSENKDAH